MIFKSITFSILFLSISVLAKIDSCQALDPKAKQIKESFLFAYNGFKKCAWKHDEALPETCKYSDSRNHWGATIVDGLDTMLIMGLDKEYEEALRFINTLDFTKSDTLSKGFETNIRYLGGLLAANDLKPNRMLVKKAVALANEALVPLFVATTKGTKVKVPYTNMDLTKGTPEPTNQVNLAEFGTYTMEFTRLSQVTGNPMYEQLVMDLTKVAIQKPTKIRGLYPTTWTVNPFEPVNSSLINIGGGGDSFYEYLIKNYLLQQDKDENLFKAWQDSVESIEDYMLSPTKQDPLIQFVAMISSQSIYYLSQELICFWPGNILLGASQLRDQEKRKKYMAFADVFLDSCMETWSKTATGISPESWTWTPQDDSLQTKLNRVFGRNLTVARIAQKSDTKRAFSIDNASYDLRPETIESLFYYYRLTEDTKYQDLAWNLYLAIDKYTKTKYGYSAIANVDQKTFDTQNFEESFLFAETLKYLYLIFTDKSCVSLDDYVFNTEAHPFKLPKSIKYQQ